MALTEIAFISKARIGTIEVDHGQTSWKTTDAAEYIHKTLTIENNNKHVIKSCQSNFVIRESILKSKRNKNCNQHIKLA